MGKDVIRKYYQGIMDQIQNEVDLINSNFHHNGLKGEGNEVKIRKIIKKFIPERYGVDTGVVIDRDGNQSKQCDIIIYDKFNHPQLLGLSSVKMFPVDLVYAVIEVKTTLDKTSSTKSIENIKSVKSLNYIKENFRVYPSDSVGEITKDTALFEIHPTSPPIGIVFGYSSSTRFNTTFSNWFKSKDLSEKPLYPSHVCCLDQGLLAINNTKDNKYRDLSTYLFPYNKDEDSICLINNDEIILSNKKWCLYENRLHPFIQVGKDKMIVDQSKILLNFILNLSILLNKKRISPNLNFRETYLSNELRNILVNHNDQLAWRKEDYPQYLDNDISSPC